jgi:hypothetical protein
MKDFTRSMIRVILLVVGVSFISHHADFWWTSPLGAVLLAVYNNLEKK